MSDSTEKKISLTIRFDAILLERLDKFRNGIIRGDRPSQNAFINDALRDALERATAGLHGQDGSLSAPMKPINKPSTKDIVTLGTPGDNVSVAPREIPWIRRLLKLLRSKNQVVRRAIKYNLLSFGLAREPVHESKTGLLSASEQSFDAIVQELEREAAEIERDTEAITEDDGKAGKRGKGGRGKVG